MLVRVTLSPTGDPAEAHDLGRRFGLVFDERRGRTLRQQLADTAGAPLLVLGATRADLYAGGEAHRATLGMAVLRALRVRAGEIDPLVAAARLVPGERVLDATLGLAGDALVAAQATGVEVVGLEASPLLCAVAVAALARSPESCRAAAGRVRVENGDHRTRFQALPPGCFDVVLLDPMFRRPRDAGPLFPVVRAHAEPAALSAPVLAAARRVARRGVLVKDAHPGVELLRLGLRPLPARSGAAICFAWVSSAPGA